MVPSRPSQGPNATNRLALIRYPPSRRYREEPAIQTDLPTKLQAYTEKDPSIPLVARERNSAVVLEERLDEGAGCPRGTEA